MDTVNIEKFFLKTLLLISMSGLTLICASHVLFFREDTLSFFIALSILIAASIAYLLRLRYPNVAVLIFTGIALATMSYQRLTVPCTMTTLSVVLIVGFIFSIMLRGKLMWIMHVIALLILNTVFIWNLDDALTAGVTYSTLYVILTFATGFLKASYDKIYLTLKASSIQANQNSKEVEAQNEELLQIQDSLSSLNVDLETMVRERTAKIQAQNDVLIKYAYTNAHNLRGPVARLLGLANVYNLESTKDHQFFVSKMVEQALEIDFVIKQINQDLESQTD